LDISREFFTTGFNKILKFNNLRAKKRTVTPTFSINIDAYFIKMLQKTFKFFSLSGHLISLQNELITCKLGGKF